MVSGCIPWSRCCLWFDPIITGWLFQSWCRQVQCAMCILCSFKSSKFWTIDFTNCVGARAFTISSNWQNNYKIQRDLKGCSSSTLARIVLLSAGFYIKFKSQKHKATKKIPLKGCVLKLKVAQSAPAALPRWIHCFTPTQISTDARTCKFKLEQETSLDALGETCGPRWHHQHQINALVLVQVINGATCTKTFLLLVHRIFCFSVDRANLMYLYSTKLQHFYFPACTRPPVFASHSNHSNQIGHLTKFCVVGKSEWFSCRRQRQCL